MPTFIPSDAKKLTERVTLDIVIAVLEHYFDLSTEGYILRAGTNCGFTCACWCLVRLTRRWFDADSSA